MCKFRERYELRCKTRDSYGRFTGICTVDWTYCSETAVEMFIDSTNRFNKHCYEYRIDTVLEPV